MSPAVQQPPRLRSTPGRSPGLEPCSESVFSRQHLDARATQLTLHQDREPRIGQRDEAGELFDGLRSQQLTA